MRSFSLARIKNIEREPIIMGMGFTQARTYLILIGVEFVYLLISHSWLEAGVCIAIAFFGYMVIAALYSSNILRNFFDKQLPDQIINTKDSGN